MRLAFIALAFLTVAGCSGQGVFDASDLKMNVDAKDTYIAVKLRVAQPCNCSPLHVLDDVPQVN